MKTGAALLLVTTAVLAQTPAEPTLHAAWLREMFYLDVAGAAQDYARLATDAKAPLFERSLAAARLAELQRLDAAPGTAPVDASDLPTQLRNRLRQLQQNKPKVEVLLAHVAEAPDQLIAWWQQTELTERPNRPGGRDPAAITANTRPLVGDVQRWVLEQSGPGNNERRRQLLAPGSGLFGFGDRHWRALQVLVPELDGRTADADHWRDLYFPSWRVPAPPKDPAAALIDARRRLEETRRGETQMWRLLPGEADALGRLTDKWDHMQSDPPAAMRLLERLPIYDELLRGLRPVR